MVSAVLFLAVCSEIQRAVQKDKKPQKPLNIQEVFYLSSSVSSVCSVVEKVNGISMVPK